MKRTFLFFLVGYALSCANAQPVLEWVAPAGVGYSADILAAGFVEPTPASADPQSWDFSGISGNSVGLFSLSPASASPFAPLFDGAEWVASQGDQLSFWMLDEDNFTVLGNANAVVGITLPFDDPLVQWTYPLEYGQVVEDAFGIEQMLFGQPYQLQGSAVSSVDAWGSLVLPDGTAYSEVLRGNYQQDYMEIYEGDTALWSLNQVMYFVPDSALAVFFHEALEVTDNAGTTLLEVTDVAWYANGVASVPQQDQAEMAAPYPNPLSEGEVLNGFLPEGWSYRVLSMEGKVMEEIRAGSAGWVQISTEGWGHGMYLLVPLRPSGEAHGAIHRVLIR